MSGKKVYYFPVCPNNQHKASKLILHTTREPIIGVKFEIVCKEPVNFRGKA